jgi:hypothetical protein
VAGLPPRSAFTKLHSFVASAVASIATGWSEPVCGREVNPLESNTFRGALFQQRSILACAYPSSGETPKPIFNSLLRLRYADRIRSNQVLGLIAIGLVKI